MTSGTFSPTGTFFSLNLPSTSVVVDPAEPLLKSAGQLHASAPVGTPTSSGCSGDAAM